MCNMGFLDRFLRFFVGSILLCFGIFTGGHLIFLAVGLVLFLTAAISFCPLYLILRINTGCKTAA